VEIYGRVRRAVRVEGRSQRAVAREFGLSRETVRKMLQYAVPPGYQRQQPIKRPKLGPWVGVIDAILEDDKQRPAKQRHTAKRIFERLKEEHGFTGGYTIVKDYVRVCRRRCLSIRASSFKNRRHRFEFKTKREASSGGSANGWVASMNRCLPAFSSAIFRDCLAHSSFLSQMGNSMENGFGADFDRSLESQRRTQRRRAQPEADIRTLRVRV
jgi:transposase